MHRPSASDPDARDADANPSSTAALLPPRLIVVPELPAASWCPSPTADTVGAVLRCCWSFRAPTAEDTREVGEALSASLARPRRRVLTGELGAGKTTFVQGVARGLGIEEPVSSPTFTLVKEYSGILDLAHVDVYRLERVQDVVDLGLG